ncbi:hypothetical protein V8G54_032545, partial [Vigna mungo]
LESKKVERLCFGGTYRNTLLIPEKVFRINLGLDIHQPIKILTKELGPINLPFFKAIRTKVVDPDIKVSIIQISTSGVTRHIRGHHTVQLLSTIGVFLSRSRRRIVPAHRILNLEEGPLTPRKRRRIRRNLSHFPSIRVENKPYGLQLNHRLKHRLQ